MGIPATLGSRPRLVLPDTPPELVSPGASSYSSRSSPSSADRTWNSPALASPRMPNYEKFTSTDMSSNTEQSMELATRSRPESSSQSAQGASRQQLPSLSSLFGPPTARPLHSPVSDRSGLHHEASPLDRPRLPTGERGSQTSYFPPALSPPVSQPRSTYDADRQPLRTLSRSFSGPESPKYRDADRSGPDSHFETRAANYSMNQEANRQEYSLGSRDSSLRSPQDQFRLQFPGPKDAAPPPYSDHRSTHTGANPPPTPTSTVNSDGVPIKDGLGPKIWTGTHFLPRFVRAAEVPGEGLCYFYDDGTHCRTMIDGEAVNAHWGVTKAGKPRKRLAIACVTCREKKIKCDPDYPRCVQCEKFGRVCKFKNAPRGGHNGSPSTPPAELDDYRRLGEPSRPSESDTSSPISPRTTLRQPSPDNGSNKRLRVGYDSYVPGANPSAHQLAPRPMGPPRQLHMLDRPASELPRIPDNVLSRAWMTDPALSDAESIRTVVNHFFVHLDSTVILRFVPEALFKSWAGAPSLHKSPEDLMLLYSVLAIGVSLSGGPKSIAHEYAQVAQFAQKTLTVNCLQLVQTRMLLSLYYLAIAHINEANEMLSAAVATASCLHLNVEQDDSRETSAAVFPLKMTQPGYREAKRRTFWSLFMLERLNGIFPDRLAMINAEDIYTRLPADIDIFEREIEASTPMFNPYASNLRDGGEQGLGISAYVVEMVHIWADDLARIYRMARRAPYCDVDTEAAGHRVHQRVVDWYRSLPSQLTFNPANLEAATQSGILGSFLTMHLLYSHALVKLNRHTVTTGQGTPRSKSLHIHNCHEHATNILDIVRALIRLHRMGQTVVSAPPPMMAVVVTEAVDVITAGGRLSQLGEVIECVQMAQGVVEAMGNVWEDSRVAREAIDGRLAMLLRIRDRGSQTTSPVEGYRIVYSADGHGDEKSLRWQIANPIERLYPKGMDNIYSSLF